MSEKIIHLNESAIKNELKELVRNSVEETLNGLLEQEAQALTNAGKYERTEGRQGYRAGHYERDFLTSSGEVKLKMPKLKGVAFETAIIERYRRRESSVEEALIEMYLAGVSVRRVEDITEALWGTKVSPGRQRKLANLPDRPEGTRPDRCVKCIVVAARLYIDSRSWIVNSKSDKNYKVRDILYSTGDR